MATSKKMDSRTAKAFVANIERGNVFLKSLNRKTTVAEARAKAKKRQVKRRKAERELQVLRRVRAAFLEALHRGVSREQGLWQLYAQEVRQKKTSLRQLVNTFRMARTRTGKIAYPRFDKVKKEMGEIMKRNVGLKRMPDGWKKMERAYKLATAKKPKRKAA